jgi:hypothetical protein
MHQLDQFQGQSLSRCLILRLSGCILGIMGQEMTIGGFLDDQENASCDFIRSSFIHQQMVFCDGGFPLIAMQTCLLKLKQSGARASYMFSTSS